MKKQDIRKIYRIQISGLSYKDENKKINECSEEILSTNNIGINKKWMDIFSKVYTYFIFLSNIEFQTEWLGFDEILIQIQFGEINIPEFKSTWDLDFDLNNDKVQEVISYQLDYEWENILEEYRRNINYQK